MIKDGEFYKLFGTLIYVNDAIPFGAEMQVYYNTKDGEEHTYIGSSKDIREDFEQTSDSFSLSFPKKEKPEVELKKDPIKNPLTQNTPTYFKVVYFNNGKVISDVKQNIPNKKMAYAIKGKYEKGDQFKPGYLKVLPQ